MPPKASRAVSSPATKFSATPTTASASKKRLTNGQIKYYGVRAGHTPGVFTDYKDVQQSTTGFKGAIFKSFTSEADARDFAAGKAVVVATPIGKQAVEKFYGVASGHIVGVYTSWDEAQKQIENFKGPRYKKFPTREEAEEFVRNKGQVSTTKVIASSKTTKASTVKPKQTKSNGIATEVAQPDDLDGPSARKKSRIDQPSTDADEFIDYLDDLLPIDEETTNTTYDDRDLKIYTDGSSLGNGKLGAIAGVGVYFGPSHTLNISEPLLGPMQTNQRAELTAILRALSVVSLSQSVSIITDSQYSINCVTKWFQNWERNGWVSSLKKEVLNKDLVQGILAKIRQREQEGAKTNFVWVKGHSTEKGNVEADRLAVAGANQALRDRGSAR